MVYFPPDRTYDKDLYKIHLVPKCARDLLDGYGAGTLQQINHIRNEHGRCLDLCFFSSRDTAPTITATEALLAKIVARHSALVVSIEGCHCTEFRNETSTVSYNFKRADYDGMSLALCGIAWDSVLDSVDVDSAVDSFTSVLRRLIEQFVPKIRKKVLHHLPCQSPELRQLKTQKRAADLYTYATTTFGLITSTSGRVAGTSRFTSTTEGVASPTMRFVTPPKTCLNGNNYSL